MAAAAPSAEEILQTACKKAAANISHFLPLSYTSSYSSSDFDEETIPPTGPEPERFVQKCQRLALENNTGFFQEMPVV